MGGVDNRLVDHRALLDSAEHHAWDCRRGDDKRLGLAERSEGDCVGRAQPDPVSIHQSLVHDRETGVHGVDCEASCAPFAVGELYSEVMEGVRKTQTPVQAPTLSVHGD